MSQPASLYDRIQQTAAFLQPYLPERPAAGIILGSGLGGLVDSVEVLHRIPYEQIPQFPVSTVKGHAGALIIGRLSGKLVVMLAGRFHYYEGYAMEAVTFV